MAKYLYYAIEAGGQKRIFNNWSECQTFRDRAPQGARYKGFNSEREAKAFLNEEVAAPAPEPAKSHSDIAPDPNVAVAYTDGSYNPATGEWGYGVILFPSASEAELHQLSGKGNWCADARNVIGEVTGAVQAIKAAVEMGFKRIVIYHDYEGVEAWATGRWKTNKEISQWYKKMVTEYSKDIEIRFKKVVGHTGVTYNEAADKLAREAAGL